MGQNIRKKTSVKSGQSTDELFTPTWIFWDSLQFLVPVVHAWQSRDTIKKDEIDDLVGEVESNDNAKGQEPVSTPTSKSQTKKSKSQMESTKQELWKECIRVLKKPEEPIPSRDVSQRFGSYVAEKLAGFDAKTRAIAEKRIADVLFELECVPNVSADTPGISSFNQSGTFDYTGSSSAPISSLYAWGQHQIS